MMKKLVFALAIFGFGGVGAADIIWDQTWDGLGAVAKAQVYPDFPDFDTFEFDDFSVAGPGYFVTALNAVGAEAGDMGANIAVIGEIWNGLPGIFGGTLVMSTVAGVENADGSVTLDFGGQALGPGDYWITLYVVRSFSDGGNWFWNRTTEGAPTGSEHYFYNPGGGFGFGGDPIPGSVVYVTPADMNFVLEGAPQTPCPWDLDDNAVVGASDLLSLLASWGPCKGCPGDFDGNGIVGASDLLALLANWGVCP